MNLKKNYETESIKLSRAIDIAIESLGKHAPNNWQKLDIENAIKTYLKFKDNVLNPLPEYKNLSSLKYHIQDVFIYFQETLNETTDYFWKQIEKEELGYERVDVLEKVLKKGKISSEAEFNYIVDIMVVAEQEGRISSKEIKKLNDMISVYEVRNSRKKVI
jgi:polyhydroxyalkanoate synthesis regulator phasin